MRLMLDGRLKTEVSVVKDWGEIGAVAAGLINLLVQLAWGLVGGAVIVREWRERGQARE